MEINEKRLERIIIYFKKYAKLNKLHYEMDTLENLINTKKRIRYLSTRYTGIIVY